MRRPLRNAPALAALVLYGLGAVRAHAQATDGKANAQPAVTEEQSRKAIDRGLAFLVADAAKWREEHACASCHHGTMTVWALSEARSRGHAVGESLSDVTKWTRERLANIDKPRDTRPGWNMVNTPAIHLSLMTQAVPAQDAVSPDDLRRIAGHLVRHQEADGSWAWSLAPEAYRPTRSSSRTRS